ncbi:hypothetical protein MMC13_001676 [Lambiella insularis]|nr:hypothetical protein [Lambiella insularis]
MFSKSPIPRHAAALASLLALTHAYTLVNNFDASNWMSSFQAQSIPDPTGGFVTYLTQSEAEADGLYQIQGDQVYFGVDHTNTISPSGPGRNSVRLMSNAAYNNALIIGDFAHMPGSDCGIWPAFWVVGPNWPSGGEIDIIEGVNIGIANQMTLHTSPGCTVTVGQQGQTGAPPSPPFPLSPPPPLPTPSDTPLPGGSVGNPDCGAGGGYNGCAVVDYVGTSYGTAFNSVGGGVYATLWDASVIQIWYWEHSQVPADVTAGAPDPSGWGTPAADFSGCAFDTYFKNMNIVSGLSGARRLGFSSLIFDTTFCGSWAGNVWAQSYCATADASCQDYVARNPQVYADGYWLVNSVKVYQ